LPTGWTERLIPFRTPRTGGVTAWCLDPHDLFAALGQLVTEHRRALRAKKKLSCPPR
jgi:hypothetical protein